MLFFVFVSGLLFIEVMIENYSLAAKGLAQQHFLVCCWVNPIFVGE
jgi:hypothetical protein